MLQSRLVALKFALELGKAAGRIRMTKLGFEPESLVKFEKAILKPYGMVLVTGPTGSGKTNTLYSSIARLNQPDTNIMGLPERGAGFYLLRRNS